MCYRKCLQNHAKINGCLPFPEVSPFLVPEQPELQHAALWFLSAQSRRLTGCGSSRKPKLGQASTVMLLMGLYQLNRGARIFVVAFFLKQVNCFLMKKLLNSSNKTQSLARNIIKI